MNEIILTVMMLVASSAFLLCGKLFAPTMETHLLLSFILIITFFFFTTFIWKEKGKDERENLHILNAGRISFLTGALILVIGIIYESLIFAIDPWLIFALIGMILAKLIAHLYQSRRK